MAAQTLRGIISIVTIIALAKGAVGDPPPLPAALRCEFESHVSAVLESGAPRFTAKIREDPGIDSLTYSAIDPGARTAQLVDNVGTSTVTLIVTGGTWAFVQVTGFGNVNVTQAFVFDEPDAAQAIYRAVHSRQMSILGYIVASQHYGHCKAL